MKTHQQILGAFTVILLFCFLLTTTSCDSDDEPSPTFLETHAGTVWEGQTDFLIYVEINNNLNNPLDLYMLDEDCYIYAPLDEDEFEILENSQHTFQFKIIDHSDNSYEITTLSYSNNKISVISVYKEEGYEDEIDTAVFTKSTKDIASLTICS